MGKSTLIQSLLLIRQSVYSIKREIILNGEFVKLGEYQDIYCESIKVNQVGYSDKSTVRYANFGVFMGDLGSVQLNKEYAQRVILNMV